ncbi:MAG: hypothetical protein JNK30_16050 [Phenylobacterium sp.]|uniref:hypothetical protein n=1 Tax=Phenylobacterium sp. TaxID=1871053 RepID=UPI001A62E31B|nr:hypothetical protein [Phenylobacterium sp.]MBL8772895.1 hypothetical protein [Phenylobacterium sp.]
MTQQAIGARARSDAGARLYVGTAYLVAALIFVGFAPSYYLKGLINAPPPLSALTMAHGVMFTAWTLLFVVQASLIGAGRPRLHRQLGMAGAMLFGGMVVLGLSTAITAAQLGHVPPASPEPLRFMALPVMGMIALAFLVGLALTLRARRDHHQRLMLAAFIMIAQPAIGRMFVPAGVPEWQAMGSFLVVEAILAAVIVLDWRDQRRVHPAWLVSAGTLAAMHVLVAWAFTGPALWMDFAAWLTRSA